MPPFKPELTYFDLMHKFYLIFFSIFTAQSSFAASQCVVPSLIEKADSETSVTESEKITMQAREVDGTRNKFSLKADVELR